MKLIQILADIICGTLLDPKALDRARRRKGAFTRNCGKLPYWTLAKLLLKDSKRTISAIHSHSNGNPRLIDSLMTDALTPGSQMDKKSIDAEVILAAVAGQNLM